MRRTMLLAVGITSALCLSGCQSKQTDVENEALRQQIQQLEQQIQDLEQKVNSGGGSAPEAAPPAAEVPAEDAAEAPAPPAEPDSEASAPSGEASALNTTCTLEELTGMVAAYEEKVNSASSTGSASDDMEQFLILKQEEKAIDHALDRHEDELEDLYRSGSLTREEYRPLEREVERLEDRLDAAEDTLEYVYGIDD